MKPIPIEAMPVVEVLRRDVPRPELPTILWFCIRCPMGLHPKSTRGQPMCSRQFAGGECSDEAVEAFYLWWDILALEEAEATAMDLIWLVAA